MKTMKKYVKTALFCSMYWLIVQLNIAKLGTRIPDKYFRQKHIIFKSFNFEKHGKFWHQWFYVKKWKHKILDGYQFNQNIYDQRHLVTINTYEVEKMIIETKRAELIHLLSILPVIMFNKSSRLVKYTNIFYTIIANVPIIIVQRYNRPRLTQLLRILKRRGERHD
ncbi:Glycosyl-4%2C4-diaponeurosporenoate acyltransferase precursor [Staphylococcus schweitzeri]|nr:Glycosyl-4%2C4-diaponeurosporenoate acyltransferase precursor [Staphylococcus schweitzeri]